MGGKHADIERGGEASVEFDAMCISCSYSLRGLALRGKCPECSTPVFKSLRGYRLAFAGTRYLKELESGLRLVVLGLAMFGAAAAVWVCTVLLGRMMPSAELLLMMIVSCTVFTGVVILNVIGYSKLATQDPRYRGIERSWWPRGMVRVSASVLAAVLLACMLVQSTSMWELLHKTLGVQAMHGWIAVLVMMVIHNVVVMSYMAKLAMRIPEPMLARTAVLYRPVLAGVAIVPCGLGIVIAMVMYGRLLYRLFKEVARVRRAIGDGAYVDRSLAE